MLHTIVAASRRAVTEREVRAPLAMLEESAPVRHTGAFRAALEKGGEGGPRIIAECKRRSPSKGILREQYDTAAIAASYAAAGAAAISVLTEPSFFDGTLADLAAARAAVSIPVLRKDFIVTRYQLAEARAAGADAVLLIVAALEDEALRDLLRSAEAYGLDALVEVHDAEELERAVAAGAAIIGVNSRNLHTLDVDTSVLHALAGRIPHGVVAVAESGIRDAATVNALRADGYRAFLVGERFMTSDDPGAALAALLQECGA
ncbi:MAG TPA: indole-3-glycerol phosphate synthase TrpC [Vicinamibacterales bacterium]|nr:indole-3-glycerol phosphate synthase TrpC [Vicinamibacterales bacterium]